MTDLTKAIAELQRISVSKTEHLLAPHDEPFATILNAALSGDLIPRADADLAVALMVEKACHVLDTAGDSAVTEALGQRLCCSGHDCGCRGADVGTYLMHLIRSEVVPASALAELQELRDSDAESKGNLAHALHQLGQAKAELATLRAQVERMTGALHDAYSHQLAACADWEAEMSKARGVEKHKRLAARYAGHFSAMTDLSKRIAAITEGSA